MMRRTKLEIAKHIAGLLNKAIIVRSAGNAMQFDIEYLVFPNKKVEAYRTGACSFYRRSNKKYEKIIEKDKERLKKRLKEIEAIDYKGFNLENYLH
jgi:hypothetical protein